MADEEWESWIEHETVKYGGASPYAMGVVCLMILLTILFVGIYV